MPFTALCDLATSVLLKDPSYLLQSALVLSDLGSFENLCIAALLRCGKGFGFGRKAPGALVLAQGLLDCHFFPVFSAEPSAAQLAVLLGKMWASSAEYHVPSINPLWYLHMHMFDQYRALHLWLMDATFLFLCLVGWFARPPFSSRLLLALFFKPSGYKSFLLLLSVLKAEFLEMGLDLRVFSFFRSLCFLGFVLENCVWCQVVFPGIGNLNFLCWATSLFVCSAFLCTLYVHAQSYKTYK